MRTLAADGYPGQARQQGPGVIPWRCTRCGEDQVAFGPLPENALCNACEDAQRAASAFTEAAAGVPERYRGLTRESWSAHFGRPWPKALQRWTGTPHWVALWGPTGIGKTALATILLAEHLRTGRYGRWISGPALAWRIQRDFTNAADVVAPLLATTLLVFDEPLTGPTADWYMERLLLITRTRDDRGLATIITSQLLPELITAETVQVPGPILSRWLSGLRIHKELKGDDVRLRGAF